MKKRKRGRARKFDDRAVMPLYLEREFLMKLRAVEGKDLQDTIRRWITEGASRDIKGDWMLICRDCKWTGRASSMKMSIDPKRNDDHFTISVCPNCEGQKIAHKT